MAFMTELLVDEYGYLSGGEDVFPVDVIEHDWETPYPVFRQPATFEWEPGNAGVRPGIFRHPEIRDWVCDGTAWSVLSGTAPQDVRLLGEGLLGDTHLYVVQVVAVLDVADLDSSNVHDYGSYRVVEFPALRRDEAAGLRFRVFRIPENYTDLFVGDLVRKALDDAGVAGLGYTPVPLADLRSEE